MLALQGGKVEAEKDAGLRVVMLGRGLHRAALWLRSLQHHQTCGFGLNADICRTKNTKQLWGRKSRCEGTLVVCDAETQLSWADHDANA